jgi:hypothetical protein
VSITLASYQLEGAGHDKSAIKRFSYTGGHMMDYLYSEILLRGGRSLSSYVVVKNPFYEIIAREITHHGLR